MSGDGCSTAAAALTWPSPSRRPTGQVVRTARPITAPSAVDKLETLLFLKGRQTIVCASYCCPRLNLRIPALLGSKNTQGHLQNLPTFAVSSSKHWTKKTNCTRAVPISNACLLLPVFCLLSLKSQCALKVSGPRHSTVFQGYSQIL